MGISKSKNMARANDMLQAEDTSASDDGSDNEADLASILQYLIRSGQVRILGREQPYLGAYPKPPTTAHANLENLPDTQGSYRTMVDSGAWPNGVRPKNISITDMVVKREVGVRGKNGSGFSVGARRVIGNLKPPVKMRIVDTYENKGFCGVYSHDGNLLLTAAQDRCLRIYDSSRCHETKLKQVIQGRDIGWSILDATFSPDASKIAYSSWSTSLHLVDVNDDNSSYSTTTSCNHLTLPLCPHERRFCVFALSFSKSGDEILCSANDGHIYVYDLNSNDRVLRVEAHDDDVNTVAFADDTSQVIFSGGDDGLCKVWDRRIMSAACPSPVGILAGHLDGVTYIDSRGDGRHFVSNSKDQSIKLWDIRQVSSKATQENAKKAVSNNKWDYRWQTAPRKLVTRKINMKGDTSLATYRGHSVLQTLVRCRFSPSFSTGQRMIITGCAFGRVIAYDIMTGNMSLKLQGHSSCVRDVSWHPHRPEIVSSSWDFSVLCWTHFGLSLEESIAERDEWGDPADCWRPRDSPPPLRRSRRIADRYGTQNA